MLYFLMIGSLLFIWAVVAFFVAIPTWLLWNWLVPDIFGLPTISVFQAFGLLLLTSCLFGSRPNVKFED